MRDRTLIRTLQLQAEDGSFVDVQEWARTPQTYNNGKSVVLPNDISYIASPGGHVEKVGPGEYVISATSVRLFDTTDEE